MEKQEGKRSFHTKKIRKNYFSFLFYSSKLSCGFKEPVIRERRITIDIVSKEITFLLVGMGLVISVLGSALYFSTRPNYDRIDNDLKYRYIKMKGEATPKRITELEDLFEINRDNAKIRQMSKDVEGYEQAVKEKAALDEQNRLRQQDAEKLNKEAEKNKGKKPIGDHRQ